MLACCLPLLSGCGAGYLLQAARGQWEVVAGRRPIPVVLADPATPDPLRRSLAEVGAARDFAVRELGLPDNASYRGYTALDRSFVVWSVVAAQEFSVEPLQWCFPVAGCVTYRGYFSEAGARLFAATLRAQGHDVSIGGVPAYSTLGRFADPVLSTMLRGDTSSVIGTLFHELAHQVLYVPGDTAFNEAFAVTVELEGMARWWRQRDDGAAALRQLRGRQRQARFAGEVAATRERLAALYAQPGLDIPERRRLKGLFLAELAESLRRQVVGEEPAVVAGLEAWLSSGLDNARLASVATYWECVPGFDRLLRSEGGELPRFYAAVRALARLPAAERRTQLCAAGVQGSPPAAAR